MAMKAKTRSTLYDILTPIVGDEEVVDDLLAQFPARDLDEPITRDFVRAEIADVRSEIASVRTDVQRQLAEAHRQMVNWLIGIAALVVTVNMAGLGAAVAILR